MTKTKKVVAVMLAFLMIFSSASVLASAWDAAVDDGKTLDISTKFFKEVSGEWVETQKVRPGDVVKARVYVGTDYYSNDSTLLFFYDKDFFTHSYAAGKNTLEVNTQSGSFATANGVAGTFTANPNLNSQVANGYVDSAFLDSYAAFAVNVEVKSANEKNVMYDNSDWLFEFTLTVADNARGEGDLFVKDTTVQNTTTQTNAAVNVPKGPADGTDADLWAMWLWDATPVLSSQPVSTISSVTFKANTGAFAAADTETYIVEDMIDTAIDASAIPAVSKEGYTFMGWIDASDETPTLEECIEAPAAIPENDLVLNAYWLKNVDITFDTDGGSEIPPLTNVTPYEPFASIENPTKAGYTFVGWDVRGGALPATYPDVDTTYTAIWALNVTVSFDTDGADPIAPIDGYAGQTFDKDAIANPAKEGHRFVKWEPSLPDVFPEASTTYKAIFETITYNVIYVVDGKFASTAQVEYGQVIPTSVTTIKLGEGKAISGWYTDSGYQTPLAGGAVMGTQSITLYAYTYNDTFDAVFMVDGDVYATVPTVYEDYIIAPENPTKPGYVFEGWEPEVGLMDSEGKTFYATWVEAESTVKYMVDGAIYEAYNIAFGDSLDVPADPEKDGFNFLGWSTVEGADTAEALPATMPANNVTYYAVFSVGSFSVTFYQYEASEHGPAGTPAPGYEQYSTANYAYGAEIVFPATPEIDNYTFTGWFDAEGNKYEAGATAPANNLELYPQYERVAVKLVPVEGSTTMIERNGVIESYNSGYTVTDDKYETADFTQYYIYGFTNKRALPTEANLTTRYITYTGDGRIEITRVTGMEDAPKLGTGTKVTLYDNITGELVEEFYLIYFGDVDGDCYITAEDYNNVNNEISVGRTWSSIRGTKRVPYLIKAANLDGSANIYSNDLNILGEVVNATITVNQITGLSS